MNVCAAQQVACAVVQQLRATNAQAGAAPLQLTVHVNGRPVAFCVSAVPAVQVQLTISDNGCERAASCQAWLPEVLCRSLHVPLLQVDDAGLEAEPLVCLAEPATRSHVPTCASVLRPALIIKYDNSYLWCEYANVDTVYKSLRELVTYDGDEFLSNALSVQFVVHQLVHCVRYVTANGLVPLQVGLDSFYIDRRLHVKADIVKLLTPVVQSDQTSESSGWRQRPLWHATDAWVRGLITNFDYIRLLNAFAGRDINDPTNQPIYPWVADFTLSESGWRDLSKTKYRLCKGDEQLELSYSQPSQSHPAHHVPELLSDIGYYVYTARQTDKQTLCQHVRQQWVPAEYPASMARLYECSPDECIEQFYTDAAVFTSRHSDMLDLQLPEWCEHDGRSFIAWHRHALDCDWVAQRLNHWIDLVFGYKLSGDAAVAAKNVHLPASHCHGRAPVQLFHKPHPVFKGNNNSRNSVTMEHLNDQVLNPLYEMTQDSNHFSSEPEQPDVLSSLDFVYSKQPEHASYGLLRRALQQLGCLLTELCAAHRFRCLPSQPVLYDERLKLARQLNAAQPDTLKWSQLCPSVAQLLKHDNATSNTQAVPRRTRLCDVLQPLLNGLQLPFCLSLVSDWLVQDQLLFFTLYSQLCASELEMESIQSLCAGRVQSFEQLCGQLLPALPKLTGGLDWLFALAECLLCSRVLMADSVPTLLALFAPYLSKADALHRFSACLQQAYNVDAPCSPDFVTLYEAAFVRQLLCWLGTSNMCNGVLPYIVQAVSGLRDANMQSRHEYALAALLPLDQHTPAAMLLSSERGSSSRSSHEHMFALEEHEDPQNHVEQAEEEALACSSSVGISSAAHRTLLRLAEELGPVLTARYITSNLLRMLALCYEPAHLSQQSGLDSCESTCDSLSARVLQCLLDVVRLYGHPFILLQYIPYAVELIAQCGKRLSAQLECGAIGCVALLQAVFPCLSDTQLMDNIQEPVIGSVLFPAVRVASSLRLVFTNNRARCVLARKCAQLLAALATRLGNDNLKRHMAAPLQRLLCTFDLLYELDDEGRLLRRTADQTRSGASSERLFASEQVLQQLHAAFDAPLAAYIFALFVPLTGRMYFEQCVANAQLFFALVNSSRQQCMGSDSAAASQPMSAASLWSSDAARGNKLSSSVSSMSSFLERMAVEEAETCTQLTQYRHELSAGDCELKGNWLAHWQHEIGRSSSDQAARFNMIPLMTFRGHKSAVRQVAVLDQESAFVTCSQDKTARVWTVRAGGGGLVARQAALVYNRHSKPISSLALLPLNQHIATVDGALHVWDSRTGACTGEYIWPHASKRAANVGTRTVYRVCAFEASSAVLAVCSKNDATVRLLDTREGRWVAELGSGTTAGAAAVHRLCCSATPQGWLVAGTTNSFSVIDLRAQKVRYAKRTPDTVNLLQRGCDGSSFLSHYSGAECVTRWSAAESSVLAEFPVPASDALHAVEDGQEHTLTVSHPNRLRVHSGILEYSEHKVQSTVLSGALTSVAYMPLNRRFVFGANNGCVQLFC